MGRRGKLKPPSVPVALPQPRQGHAQQVVIQSTHPQVAPPQAAPDERLSWLKSDIGKLQDAVASLADEVQALNHSEASKAQSLHAEAIKSIKDTETRLLSSLGDLKLKMDGALAQRITEAQRNESHDRTVDEKVSQARELAVRAMNEAAEAKARAQASLDRMDDHVGEHGRNKEGQLDDAHLSPLVASLPGAMAAVIASRPKAVGGFLLAILSTMFEGVRHFVRDWGAPLLHFLGFTGGTGPTGGSGS